MRIFFLCRSDFHLTVGAVVGFLERDGHRALIRGRMLCSTPARPKSLSCLARSTAEDAAEELGEQVVEIAAVLHACPALRAGPLRPVEPARRAAALCVALVGSTQLVVARTLLRVGQHLVGFVDLFEPLLGLLIAGVAVGMIFHRQLSVGGADFILRGSFRDAQSLVVVPVIHGKPSF